MIMPNMLTESPAETDLGTEEGCSPTIVSGPVSASPELTGGPRRLSFTAQDRLRILAEINRAAGTGGIGAILRREGLYSSARCDWRRQRDAGALGALTPSKRGPKPPAPNPLAAELASARRAGNFGMRRSTVPRAFSPRTCWGGRPHGIACQSFGVV